ADDHREDEVSRCSDLLTAVAIAIDRLAEGVTEAAANGTVEATAIDLASILDENAAAIAQIAEDTSKSVDERMRLIAIVKPDAQWWDSPQWAGLLKCTAGWIRQQPTWIRWRE